MGRDFFDTAYLLGKTKPDYNYLKKELNIADSEELGFKFNTIGIL